MPPLPSWPQSAEPSSTHGNGTHDGSSPPAAGAGGAPPSDYFLPVYRRHEVSVEHEITLPCPG